jgi:glyoxylase-like metal-dependent hydrolase (beta-lactamase superfamily II)
MFHLIDLHFQGLSRSIACFLLETEKGPLLFETGPHSSYPRLLEGLAEKGYRPGDLLGAFVTHIHLDHAGASWALAQEGVPVYVHPFGYKHLLDPSKLMDSARRIYLEKMDTLWGDMRAIPEDKLIAVEDGAVFDYGDVQVKALHTPGHAVHHIAWQVGGDIICGDVAGVKIEPGPVIPPCPPPDINIEDWKDSIGILKAAKPHTLWLTHFGPVSDPGAHLDELERQLDYYANWMKPHFEAGESPEEITPLLQQMADEALEEYKLEGDDKLRYDFANPAWMSVAGLLRYWKKKTS